MVVLAIRVKYLFKSSTMININVLYQHSKSMISRLLRFREFCGWRLIKYWSRKGRKGRDRLSLSRRRFKNEKGSASYIVRWRKKKLEFLITPQPNDEFEIRNEARLALHGQIVFPDTEYGSWTATFVQPESVHGCLLMLHDPHDEVGR